MLDFSASRSSPRLSMRKYIRTSGQGDTEEMVMRKLGQRSDVNFIFPSRRTLCLPWGSVSRSTARKRSRCYGRRVNARFERIFKFPPVSTENFFRRFTIELRSQRYCFVYCTRVHCPTVKCAARENCLKVSQTCAPSFLQGKQFFFFLWKIDCSRGGRIKD